MQVIPVAIGLYSRNSKLHVRWGYPRMWRPYHRRGAGVLGGGLHGFWIFVLGCMVILGLMSLRDYLFNGDGY